MTQATLFTIAGGILSVLISPLLGGVSLEGLTSLWWVVGIMILAQAFGNVLYFKGLSQLEASVTSIAFSSILLWSILLSIVFLGSTFSIQQSLGILILFIAIIIVQYTKGIKKIEPAILYVIGAAFLFSVFQVASAELAKTVATATYLLMNYMGSAAVIGIVYRKTIQKDLLTLTAKKRSVLLPLIMAAVCSVGYFVFSYFAYMKAPDRGVVVVLLTSQVVLSVMLGIVLLKEHTRIGLKLGAAFLAAIAGILIKSS